MNLNSDTPIISTYSPISSKGGGKKRRRRTRKHIRSKNTRTRRRYH
jgi:hypothetical protein